MYSVRKTDNNGKLSAAYQMYCYTKGIHVYVFPKGCLNFFKTPLCSLSASRHHSSAFSDCLHAHGCGDYACHFRFGSTYWSVCCFLCMYMCV